MMLHLYRLIAAPTLTMGLFIFSPFNAKLRGILRAKLKPRPQLKLGGAPVWIHAASGEFEYAKALIREIKTREPSTPVLVTYTSTTYVKSIENFPGVDACEPLPLDLPGPVSSFLRRVRPKCLLISRTDLWPELLTQARSFGLPIIPYAFTQKDPGRLNPLARGFRRWLLSLTDQILCVSTADQEALRHLGIRHTFVTGDPRYDQVRHRLDNPKPLPESLRPTLRALVAGSTWPADEKVLLKALSGPLKSKQLQLILVPHEPNPAHLSQLKAALTRKGLSYKTFSAAEPWSNDHVLIVDQVGILADLYAWGEIGFVGGSFKRSVHSVMEPLGAGLPTLVGPYHTNNREAVEFSTTPTPAGPAVRVCANVGDVKAAVSDLLAAHRASQAQAIRAAFDAKLGASRRIYNLLFSSPAAGAHGDPG